MWLNFVSTAKHFKHESSISGSKARAKSCRTLIGVALLSFIALLVVSNLQMSVTPVRASTVN